MDESAAAKVHSRPATTSVRFRVVLLTCRGIAADFPAVDYTTVRPSRVPLAMSPPPPAHRALVAILLAGIAPLAASSLSQRATSARAPDAGASSTPIPYVDAKPVLEQLRQRLPADLAAKTPADLESAWPGWVARRNAEIRARLEQGDEDSIINLLLFGTTFTRL